MSLKVIGAGLGRTGTTSLKFALEQLGLGRCYHMIELFPQPETAGLWLQALDGTLEDWDEIFADFGATTDWPGCSFWRQLMQRYPDAPVILTEREAGAWFDSTQRTIFSDATKARLAHPLIEQLTERLIFRSFDGRVHDRDHCIEVFERHNAEVRTGVPAGRLLIYDIAQGWEPLCSFLGRPVPDTPFPRANTTDDFVNHRVERAAQALEGSA